MGKFYVTCTMGEKSGTLTTLPCSPPAMSLSMRACSCAYNVSVRCCRTRSYRRASRSSARAVRTVPGAPARPFSRYCRCQTQQNRNSLVGASVYVEYLSDQGVISLKLLGGKLAPKLRKELLKL